MGKIIKPKGIRFNKQSFITVAHRRWYVTSDATRIVLQYTCPSSGNDISFQQTQRDQSIKEKYYNGYILKFYPVYSNMTAGTNKFWVILTASWNTLVDNTDFVYFKKNSVTQDNWSYLGNTGRHTQSEIYEGSTSDVFTIEHRIGGASDTGYIEAWIQVLAMSPQPYPEDDSYETP